MGEVEVEVDAPDAVVQADSEQLRTVFTNLLLNAAQAMECHGRIRMTARIEHDHCTFIVHDSGPGMPDDVRARAFEPFYTTKHRGTGLGLPTVKRIIDSHQGTIGIDCPASGGTVVRIVLPCTQAPAPPRASSPR